MKILFSTHLGAKNNQGGGEIQLKKTKEYLEKKAVKVDLIEEKTKIKEYDLLHNFSLHRNCITNIKKAEKEKIPLVLSTIYWPSKEVIVWQTWENKIKASMAGIINRTNLFGISKPKEMIKKSKFLLPNSNAEKEMLKREFKVPEEKIRVIPNAVDKSFFNADKKEFEKKTGLKDFVLFAGRIEPRKNVLNLIKALNEIKQPSVIIGNPHSEFTQYFDQCKKTAKKNIYFMKALNHESSLLKSAYAGCKVFVLPSWYETPGLTALEAGANNANIVVTEKGCTKEYFGGYVDYINPANIKDIKEKITTAFNKEKTNDLSKHILKNFTWEKTAEKTIQVYKEVLEK